MLVLVAGTGAGGHGLRANTPSATSGPLKAFKDANELYQQRARLQGGRPKLQQARRRPQPGSWAIAYFFLGNSYDNLYKPAKKGDPENDAYLPKAVENYKLAIDKLKGNRPDRGAQIRSCPSST